MLSSVIKKLYLCIKIDITHMDEYAKAIDVKEMGKRFKLVRQKLGMTQTNIA